MPRDPACRHLLVTYDFPPMGGGIARWMGELARRYPPQSLLVSTGQYPGAQAADAQLPQQINRLSTASKRLRTVQGVVRWSRQAARLARAAGAEFLWCGNFKPAGYPVRWVHRQLGTPYGILLYGTELLLLRSRISRSALKRSAARSLLASAAVLVTISRYTRDLCLSTLEDLELGHRDIDIRVVPLGTDPQRFRPGIDTRAVRARYGLHQGRWLLTVARLVAHKGIDTVLMVVAALSSDFPDLRYAVVGSGPWLGRLQDLARTLGVADRVRFLTSVPDEDLPPLYNVASIYVGVSRPVELMIEGFGISLCEASASGLAVVGGSAGGIPDAVKEGETGLLVDPERLEAVTAAVRRMLTHPAMANRLGQTGRRAVENYYNWDRVTGDIIRIGDEHARLSGTPGASVP